jgi:hypothetical protein
MRLQARIMPSSAMISEPAARLGSLNKGAPPPRCELETLWQWLNVTVVVVRSTRLYGDLGASDAHRQRRAISQPRSCVRRLRASLTVRQAIRSFWPIYLTLKCECGYTGTAQPETLAALAGWDALLATVVKRLRYLRCGRRRCSATVRPETKRDG